MVNHYHIHETGTKLPLCFEYLPFYFFLSQRHAVWLFVYLLFKENMQVYVFLRMRKWEQHGGERKESKKMV